MEPSELEVTAHAPITDEDLTKNLTRAKSYRIYTREEEEANAIREQFAAIQEHQGYFMDLFERMGNNPLGVGPEDFVARFGRIKMADSEKFSQIFDGGVIAFQRYGPSGHDGKIIPISLTPYGWRFNQWPATTALIRLANDAEVKRIRSASV